MAVSKPNLGRSKNASKAGDLCLPTMCDEISICLFADVERLTALVA